MKVGDYVRTKDYGFIKVKSFYYNEDMIHILDENCNEYDFSKELVDDFKSSPNIIDLIEAGDYVNGCKIIELATNIEGKVLYLETDITEFDNVYACGNINIYEKDIRTIVTKEQFSQMEYKVGD